MTFSNIKKYYFTVCAVLFVLLLVLTLARGGWTLTPQSMLSMLVGWLLLCAVIIGLIYFMIVKKGSKSTEKIKEEDKSEEGKK